MSGLLHILQHALGVDQYGQGRPYREHFVAGPGHSDFETCLAAVEQGLMRRHENPQVFGGNIFTVTQAGRAHVADNSPAAPKMSRSQRRYREYLNADCGLHFSEWLKLPRPSSLQVPLGAKS